MIVMKMENSKSYLVVEPAVIVCIVARIILAWNL